MQQVYLAVDIGGSSGRVVGGEFDGQKVRLEEVYRFENGGSAANERMYWDMLKQWDHIVTGLSAATEKYGERIISLGLDTWGVDFGLLGKNDELISNPFHYRDPQLDGILEWGFERVSREEIFAQTGLQFMEINSLFQLLALQRRESPILDFAEHMLMIPDLFNWLLTGEKANEFTNATTTQLLNPKTGEWAIGLMEKFGLPERILGNIALPGTKLGKLRSSVAKEIGHADIEVVLPGTHDTASAVMAVPSVQPLSNQPNWCYISSGTWSLMGVEVADPIINERCLELNFTNEGGVGGSVRVLKNITGLWIVQQCRQAWNEEGQEYSWAELVNLAAASKPLQSFIDPDHSSFGNPGSMPQVIGQFCSATGQIVPETPGEIVRCALESLALKYHSVLGMLESLTGGAIEIVHIVGGGTQNKLLCQMTADACQRQVVAGPMEATATGNLLVQLIANGAVANIAEARQIVTNSFTVDTYTPDTAYDWSEAAERFAGIVG
ncbi:MAG: rhamnulokinase [Planctomycetaceae bacterium]|nr:rhamnulokinase [Planctomycetaceae bacterium]|tara:strand:- start:498 stop:1985 length:1488 start_codon:yes stop_codon:yes gene_type:complete